MIFRPRTIQYSTWKNDQASAQILDENSSSCAPFHTLSKINDDAEYHPKSLSSLATCHSVHHLWLHLVCNLNSTVQYCIDSLHIDILHLNYNHLNNCSHSRSHRITRHPTPPHPTPHQPTPPQHDILNSNHHSILQSKEDGHSLLGRRTRSTCRRISHITLTTSSNVAEEVWTRRTWLVLCGWAAVKTDLQWPSHEQRSWTCSKRRHCTHPSVRTQAHWFQRYGMATPT